jgi:hypothetical protein
MTKTCKKCGVTKKTIEFYRHQQTVDGYTGSCKQCIRKQNKEYQQKLRGLHNPIKARVVYRYEYQGNTYSRKQLSEKFNIKPVTLADRLKRNNNILDDSVLCPLYASRHELFIKDEDGKKIALAEFCRKHDLKYKLVLDRFLRGCRDTAILKQPAYTLNYGTIQASREKKRQNQTKEKQ